VERDPLVTAVHLVFQEKAGIPGLAGLAGLAGNKEQVAHQAHRAQVDPLDLAGCPDFLDSPEYQACLARLVHLGQVVSAVHLALAEHSPDLAVFPDIVAASQDFQDSLGNKAQAGHQDQVVRPVFLVYPVLADIAASQDFQDSLGNKAQAGHQDQVVRPVFLVYPVLAAFQVLDSAARPAHLAHQGLAENPDSPAIAGLPGSLDTADIQVSAVRLVILALAVLADRRMGSRCLLVVACRLPGCR
jgi:hypothetical protein